MEKKPGHGNSYLSSQLQWEAYNRRMVGKSGTLSPKESEEKRTGGMAKEVECLPRECKALSSNPNTTKRSKD
jgi:hypothetical protein